VFHCCVQVLQAGATPQVFAPFLLNPRRTKPGPLESPRPMPESELKGNCARSRVWNHPARGARKTNSTLCAEIHDVGGGWTITQRHEKVHLSLHGDENKSHRRNLYCLTREGHGSRKGGQTKSIKAESVLIKANAQRR